MYCSNPECPDFKETGVPGEYVEGVTVCPFCGSDLVEQMPDMNSPQARSERTGVKNDFGTPDDLGEGLVVIATYSFRHDAELAMTYLMNNGIEAVESPDDCGGTNPVVGFATGIRLLVPEGQANRAIALLKKVERDK